MVPYPSVTGGKNSGCILISKITTGLNINYGRRIAAARTVVHNPFLWPSAD